MERTEISSKTVFGNQSYSPEERDKVASSLKQKLRADEVETRPGPHGIHAKNSDHLKRKGNYIP
jgi:hypothetical protein